MKTGQKGCEFKENSERPPRLNVELGAPGPHGPVTSAAGFISGLRGLGVLRAERAAVELDVSPSASLGEKCSIFQCAGAGLSPCFNKKAPEL